MPSLKIWAQALKRDVMTLWFALKHPDTPWYARALAGAVTAYALSPIDLIPDFIPVIGYLDDILVVPAGVWLLIRILPAHVLTDCRTQADQWYAARHKKPCSYGGLAFMATVWALAAWAGYRWVMG